MSNRVGVIVQNVLQAFFLEDSMSDFGSIRPDFGLGRPDLRSERPDLGSIRPTLGFDWLHFRFEACFGI